MKKIIVLGAGMVGTTMAKDLSKKYIVTSVDFDTKNFDYLRKFGVNTIQQDLSDTNMLTELIIPFDLVIGAVPGFMGFNTLKNVIEAGKDIVDISFFPEDAFELDNLAKKHNVTAIVDCGVAPGMSNLILGYHNSISNVNSFLCYVGGLPFKRDFPFEYKAPFSPIDVIEEYTRPARYVENGFIITKPALSDPELINFDFVGSLEAFNTDGLRSLTKTMNIKDMKEKTLRYPGHIKLIQSLKESGFFSKEKLNLKDQQVIPFDYTVSLLFNQWKLKPEHDEFTVMKIIINTEENGIRKEYIYDLFDRKDFENQDSSMARTTGFACTSAASLILENKFSRKGVIPPEFIGEEKDCFDYMMSYQKQRGVVYRLTERSYESTNY